VTAALPYYCPTAMDIDCCPEHGWPTPCCDRPELHKPIEPPADGGCLFAEATARVLADATMRRSVQPRSDDPDRFRALAVRLRAEPSGGRLAESAEPVRPIPNG
jgi:hypothetical protein